MKISGIIKYLFCYLKKRPGGWRSWEPRPDEHRGGHRFDKMGKGFVYILKSLKTGRYYIGSTNNLKRRLAQHAEEKVLATKGQLPYKDVFAQEYEDLSKARSIEQRLKRNKNRAIIEKIVQEQKIKLGGWRSWERV